MTAFITVLYRKKINNKLCEQKFDMDIQKGRSGGSSRPSAAKASAPAEDDFTPDDMPEDDAINLDDIPF